MEASIGVVNDLEGKFYAKESSGNVIELKDGDVIQKDMIVYGDKNNNVLSHIDIVMNNGSQNITLSGINEQSFDSSLVYELSIEDGIETNTVNEAIKRTALVQEEEIEESIEDLENLEPTAAGEENTIPTSESRESIFSIRDGAQTDIIAGLRSASFNEDETIIEEDGQLFEEDGQLFLEAELNIEGVSLVYEGGTAVYALSVTNPPVTDLDVNVRISILIRMVEIFWKKQLLLQFLLGQLREH